MNNYFITSTPAHITSKILEFCSQINCKSQPIFVPVKPSAQTRYNYCLTDVPRFVQNNGGKTIFGWTIWESPDLFLEAEFHACWSDQKGNLIDITPKPDGESRILFLPDSQRTYEHTPVDNIRMPLVDNPFTRLWLLIKKKEFEIRQKHFSNDQVNTGAAAKEFENWFANLEKEKMKIGRNDPCICGSGRKYKKCCGQ